ncbi:hypothetical protein [Ferruginibacter sp. HRS2-29]|uniref:hypothetical protein n=1 Tax=Ferruginibacter sp. HRS2-29 TaxID=2487334 RepID=UPI0020CD6E5F|nr:hypothetical protein [Ferruginibacter sp. HRS2-29]MCP9752847.1 hypothetical protein [Ferruginibacter sp. HRS2-29]
MSFFKRLFSGNKKGNPSGEEIPVNGIITEEHMKNWYTRDDIDPAMLEGCLKMVESYFLDNKLEWNKDFPVNHPENLDKTVDEGFGFRMYCKAFQLEEAQATLFLALAFSNYLINEYGFVLYKDKEPEYPLRGMTLKYDRNGVLLSLYPFEYASKVLDYEGSFTSMNSKLAEALQQMPDKEEIMKNFLPKTD